MIDKKTTQEVTVGKDVDFDRIRRITGYLVGTLDRFNNAKKAEEHDRVKHGI
ncbi:MAG: ribonucleoside-triphosphate reductase [Clostridiales bacterium]|nr:ribonucleoside-triphosphate reductase [Clostridiales bacterium]